VAHSAREDSDTSWRRAASQARRGRLTCTRVFVEGSRNRSLTRPMSGFAQGKHRGESRCSLWRPPGPSNRLPGPLRRTRWSAISVRYRNAVCKQRASEMRYGSSTTCVGRYDPRRTAGRNKQFQPCSRRLAGWLRRAGKGDALLNRACYGTA
jgi:hypothetical protein